MSSEIREKFDCRRDADVFYAQQRINASDIKLHFPDMREHRSLPCLNSYARESLDALAQMLSVYYLSLEGISQ